MHIKLIIDKLHEQAAFRHPAMVDFVKNLSRSRLNSAVIRLRISLENYQKLLAWLFWLKQKLSRPKSADKGEPG